jgi:hypothetical protein
MSELEPMLVGRKLRHASTLPLHQKEGEKHRLQHENCQHAHGLVAVLVP